MNAKINIPCAAWRLALAAATLTLGACDVFNDIANSGDDDEDYYYVSLGTSLSVGVQPNSSGVLLPTNDGYPDQLFDLIEPGFEAGGTDLKLNLVKYGCPGETFESLINGGSCPYVDGSQLDAAVDFISDNRDRIHLITIDVGGNDFRNANCIGTSVDLACATTVSNQIAADLTNVLTALRNAAGPDTTIVGMNYYNPYLGSWVEDAAGQTLAMESAQAAAILNGFLSTTYAAEGVTMADIYTAFDSEEFVMMVPSMLPAPNDMLPVSVANICTFTYMCDAPPVGPDVHATNAGYSLVADTLAAVLP